MTRFQSFLEETLPVSSESSRVHIPEQKPQLKKIEDDRKQKGGKKLEQNTTFEIPEEIYADYCTPDEEIHGKETMAKCKIRLQKIERTWAKEWKEFIYDTPKYAKKFTLKPPCKKPPQGDQQAAHPSSVETIKDYLDDKDKYLSKLQKKAEIAMKKLNDDYVAAATPATSSAAEVYATGIPQKKTVPKKPKASVPKEQLPQKAALVKKSSTTPQSS
ncbi:hypothetical protein ZWY2020_040296 [Hordeum vulgare]|nr:hypothetical protein ZWY2020_040296 [Hordeum vulgare]